MWNKKLMLLTLVLILWLVLPMSATLAQDEATPIVEVQSDSPDVIIMSENLPGSQEEPGATVEITTRVQTIILSVLAAVVVIITVFGSLFVMALRYVYKSIPQELRLPVQETVLSSVEYAKGKVTQLTDLPGDVDDRLREIIFKAVDERLRSVFETQAAIGMSPHPTMSQSPLSDDMVVG